MKKFIQKKLKDQKGMTLIELLAVIVIIAIIAAIAIPAIGNIIENSRYSAVKSDGLNVIAGAQVYFTENAQETTVTVKKLKDLGYLESSGKLIDTDSIAKPATGTTGALKLTSANIEFSGSKKVKFTNATIELINGDTTKGSAVTDTVKVIGTTTP